MRGFDDKALILFPKWDNWESKPYNYKYQFKKAVTNLIAYLHSVGISPHVFYTDDVARDLRYEDFVWVSTLGRADKFFISKYCDACSDALSLSMVEHDDLYNEILRKDPGSADMKPEERFEMVLRHANKAAMKLIPQYKIVIHFMYPSHAQYKVTTKPGDGKIRININAHNLSPVAYLSGTEENVCDLLNLPCASRCLDLWEVPNE